MIQTDSTAANITNDTSSVSHGQILANHRKIGTHNFVKNAQFENDNINQNVLVQDDDSGGQRSQMKKIHTLGNSLGAHKRSLNISQQFGDSINDLTLAKTGKLNNLNLSSLLKSHLLDEDGIEDLHFYFVSFNQHKQGILKQHEIIVSSQK